MNIGQLYEEVKDNLVLEGIDKPPNRPRLIRIINRAKDDLVALLESVDPLCFLVRKSYSVDSAAASITLPDGDTEGEPRWRRILGLSRDYTSHEAIVRIYDRRSDALRESPAGFYMYREGNTLYFNDPGGAPGSMTLLLRYSAAVDDLDGTDTTAEYDYIPEEWLDLIVMRATMDLLPAANAGRYKWKERYVDRTAVLGRSAQLAVHDSPSRVKMVDAWP